MTHGFVDVRPFVCELQNIVHPKIACTHFLTQQGHTAKEISNNKSSYHTVYHNQIKGSNLSGNFRAILMSS